MSTLHKNSQEVVQHLRPNHFSVMHMKEEETPTSVLPVQEPGSEFHSLSITEVLCYSTGSLPFLILKTIAMVVELICGSYKEKKIISLTFLHLSSHLIYSLHRHINSHRSQTQLKPE